MFQATCRFSFALYLQIFSEYREIGEEHCIETELPMIQFGENIFNEGGTPVKIVWLIEICLNETFAKFVNVKIFSRISYSSHPKEDTLSRYVTILLMLLKFTRTRLLLPSLIKIFLGASENVT
jgi:hypothetical protein